MIGWLIDWLIDCLMKRYVDRLIDQVINWWLIDWSNDWLVDWLMNWLVCSFINWLIDWLIDWLNTLYYITTICIARKFGMAGIWGNDLKVTKVAFCLTWLKYPSVVGEVAILYLLLAHFASSRWLKPRANGRNIVGQQLPTLLAQQCWELLRPFARSLRPRAAPLFA